MATDVKVRHAVEERDAGKVFSMVRACFSDAPLPIDTDRIKAMVLEAFGEGAIFVAEIDDDLVGSIGLVVSQPPYTEACCLSDLWFYIRRDAEKTKTGSMLISSAQGFAERNNLPLVVSIVGGDLKRRTNEFSRLMMPRGVVFVSGVYHGSI